MTQKIYFVVEQEAGFTIAPYVTRHLSGHDVSFGTNLPEQPGDYCLIVLWNLRRIVRDLPVERNVVVFHSSDLPKGRGWSPIYYALANDQAELVISAVIAAPEVDRGDIIAKARLSISSSYTAEDLRAIDEEACVMLAAAIVDRFADRPMIGAPQRGVATYYSRRKPEDNEVDIERTLAELIPHLRACESRHPAFFYWRGSRYRLSITTDVHPGFPADLRIQFSEDDSQRPE
jgi:methionyl-tRNA formyltransferase